MALLEAIILLVILVIFSNVLSHYLVSIPTALIEIAIGVIAAIVLKLNVELETDWFMLLFVAPLLYNDAQHFPKKDLWELRAPIFANAIWLVLLTTVAGGLLINQFVAEISLPLSFALAAVLSPTDPVAVQGIAEQVKLPKRLLSLINGESLINDASGLIAFKYALAAFLTGQFSLQHATLDFLYMSVVGIIVGILISKIIYFCQRTLLHQGIQDVILHTSLQVITPFVIFIVAEMFHASGVIAVVVGGVISMQQDSLYRGPLSEIKLVTTKMWDIIIYLLNGVVFVMLGATLPFSMRAAIINPAINNWILILYVIGIWLVLLTIRTFWSYGYMWMNYFKTSDITNSKPRFATALLTGLTGVRGAVTMAMVLSIPFFLPNGELFRERYLIIFLASGVILTSLLVAVVTLPILTKEKKRLVLTGDDAFFGSELEEQRLISDLTEIEARKLMTKQAIKYLKAEMTEMTEDNKLILNALLKDLDKQLRFLYLNDDTTSNKYYHDLEVEYRSIAVNAEYEGIIALTAKEPFSKSVTKRYLQMLKYKKKAHSSNITIVVKQSFYRAKKQTKQLLVRAFIKQKHHPENRNDIEVVKLETASASCAIQALLKVQRELDPNDSHLILKKNILSQIILEYQGKINRIKLYQLKYQEEYQLQYQDYFLKILDEERNVVQTLLEQGKINQNMANQLRQSVNYNETTFLQGTFN